MARPATLSLNKRSQLDQRATFDSTTPDLDVSARTINAVEQESVGAPSSGSYQLASALGILNNQAPSMMQGFQERYQAEKEQGAFLASQGKDKPVDGKYLIEGYEANEGELHARQYTREANLYYKENFHKLEPKEFNEGLKALSEQYIESAPSDAYLKNFIPRASLAEAELLNKYQLDMADEYKVQSLAVISEIVSDELDVTLSKDLGIELEGITNRPQDYVRTAIELGGSDVGPLLRELLTTTQAKGKRANLDKQAISTLFVEQIGAIAVENGMPELLDFASIEDNNKIRLETNPELMGTIESYRNKAENNRDTILQALDKQEQKRLEDEAKEIRFIIENLKYEGVNATIKKLNEWSKRKWQSRHVAHFIKNQYIRGAYRSQKREQGKKVHERYIEDYYPKIVSDTAFYEAVEAMKRRENKKEYGNTSIGNLNIFK